MCLEGANLGVGVAVETLGLWQEGALNKKDAKRQGMILWLCIPGIGQKNFDGKGGTEKGNAVVKLSFWHRSRG